MGDIFNYLEWRGDLSFKNDGLNRVDALILSRLAYIPFDNIVHFSLMREITLCEAADRFFLSENIDGILWGKDPELLRKASDTERFGSIRLCGYVNEVDRDLGKQFSAVVFRLPSGESFIAFRGTDDTFVGWREEFNMYSLSTLPSQKRALEYFARVGGTAGKLYLGGHSKGGNLAIFSSVFCSDKLRKQIVGVYNFDGPGFPREVIMSEEYSELRDKLHTYVPQSSVFGMMLEHDEDFSIVKSTNKSFMQHDVYSWQIIGKRFEYLSERTNSSYFFDNTLSELVDKMTPDEISGFIDALFTVIEGSDNSTFTEIQRSILPSVGSMLRSLANLDKDQRSAVFTALKKAVFSAKDNIKYIGPRKKAEK